MASSLLSIASQGLQAHQSALATTGQNITNVNTPGYSRQQSVFESRDAADQTLGVVISDTRRISDRFVTQQLWSDTAVFNRSDSLSQNADVLSNLIADADTSVSSAMDTFFSALQTGVDNPASQPNRELILAEADALVRRFRSLDDQLERLNEGVNDQLVGYAQNISQLAENIAELNQKILLAEGQSLPPNELLDKREEIVRQLSEVVDISIVETNQSSLDVFIGKGQPLVIGDRFNPVVLQSGDPDLSQRRLGVNIGGIVQDVTSGISGGRVGGILAFREDLVNPALNELGRLAIVLSDTINQQHANGIDLEGNFGLNLFNDINEGATQSYDITATSTNSVTTVPSVQINDRASLFSSNYTVEFVADIANPLGDPLVRVTRTSDGLDPTGLGDFSYFPGDTLTFDGLTVSLDATRNASFSSGPPRDGFVIQSQPPTSTDRIRGASDNSLAAQTGNPWLEITDTSQLEASEYVLTFASSSTFSVRRLSDGTQTDFTYPFDSVFNLDGMTVSLHTPTDPTDSLVYEPGDQFLLQPAKQAAGLIDVEIQSARQLAFASPVVSFSDSGNFGSAAVVNLKVTDPDAGSFLAVSGALTPPVELVFNATDPVTYSVFDISDPTNPMPLDLGSGPLQNIEYDAGSTIQLDGYSFEINGQPSAGDRFTFDFNQNGVSDNRNALLLSDLQQADVIGITNYQELYGSLVQSVGSKTSVARIDLEASQTVLQQTTDLKEGISGVNLDEEAARLIQFEQAYNAAAQLISVSRTIFDTLLSSVR